MPLRNRDGDPIDPVPYLVVLAVGFLVAFSFLPGYCLALGLPLWTGLLAAGVVFVGFAAVTYHRMVLTSRPEIQREVPAELRVRKLFYVVLVVCAVLAGLTVLLVVP